MLQSFLCFIFATAANGLKIQMVGGPPPTGLFAPVPQNNAQMLLSGPMPGLHRPPQQEDPSNLDRMKQEIEVKDQRTGQVLYKLPSLFDQFENAKKRKRDEQPAEQATQSVSPQSVLELHNSVGNDGKYHLHAILDRLNGKVPGSTFQKMEEEERQHQLQQQHQNAELLKKMGPAEHHLELPFQQFQAATDIVQSAAKRARVFTNSGAPLLQPQADGRSIPPPGAELSEQLPVVHVSQRPTDSELAGAAQFVWQFSLDDNKSIPLPGDNLSELPPVHVPVLSSVEDVADQFSSLKMQNLPFEVGSNYKSSTPHRSRKSTLDKKRRS